MVIVTRVVGYRISGNFRASTSILIPKFLQCNAILFVISDFQVPLGLHQCWRRLTLYRRSRRNTTKHFLQKCFEAVPKSRAKKSIEERIAYAIHVVENARDEMESGEKMVELVRPSVGVCQDDVDDPINVIGHPTSQETDDQRDWN